MDLDPGDITHPTVIAATCVDCEQQRSFTPAGGDPDDRVVVYECPVGDCGHTIDLDLDP